MPDTIIPPLPINIPGNQGTVTLEPGTGISYFPPPSIALGIVSQPVIPGETPPNAQPLVGFGVVTQNIVPGLVAVRQVP